jgi:DNA-binding transcriptional ArsR family regulator
VEGTQLFRALGDRIDRVILEFLIERKMACVRDIREHLLTAEHVTISQPGLSFHLATLRQDGLIDYVPSETKHYYHCTADIARTVQTLIKVVQIANADEPLRGLVIA